MNKQEAIEHFKKHIDRFNSAIDNKLVLQPSSDYLKPLIPIFEEETNTSVRSCSDCLIDMLIWFKLEIKKNESQSTKKEKSETEGGKN